MESIIGVEIERNENGIPCYMHIDLQKYGNNPLLEDFLDMLLIESRKEEETISFAEVVNRQNKKRELKKCTV